MDVRETTLSMREGEPHFSVGGGHGNMFGQDANELVKFGVDMSGLSEYLDNII